MTKVTKKIKVIKAPYSTQKDSEKKGYIIRKVTRIEEEPDKDVCPKCDVTRQCCKCPTSYCEFCNEDLYDEECTCDESREAVEPSDISDFVGRTSVCKLPK